MMRRRGSSGEEFQWKSTEPGFRNLWLVYRSVLDEGRFLVCTIKLECWFLKRYSGELNFKEKYKGRKKRENMEMQRRSLSKRR